MDASYKIQRGIHVHLIQFFMCPEFWVHIIKQGNDTSISTGYEETPKGRTICDRRTGQLSICQSERQAQSCD